MLALVALVLSIGIADSVNPSTVAPALFLAMRPNAARSLAGFTAGVFSVYTFGGVILALGPGQAALAALPRPDHDTVNEIELAGGVALLLLAAALWFARERLARRVARESRSGGRSSFLVGAAIMAFELPTAFPYFAAVAAIVGSNRSLPVQIGLIVMFNLAFVAPLIAITAVRALEWPRGERALATVRAQLDRRVPMLVSAFVFVLAIVVLTIGIVGIT